MTEISHGEVRESIAIARSHGEKFFEQIVWQVENQVWTILGYVSWDAMREAEYSDMGVVAPRADRPELVSRLRSSGLKQKSIADTLGIGQQTVSDVLNTGTGIEDQPATITNSRGQQRPASYVKPKPVPAPEPAQPSAPTPAAPAVRRRRPWPEAASDAAWKLEKIVTTIKNLAKDDRFAKYSGNEAPPDFRRSLAEAVDALQRIHTQLTEGADL